MMKRSGYNLMMNGRYYAFLGENGVLEMPSMRLNGTTHAV